MEHKPSESEIKSNLRQILICLLANIATLSGGMTLGFSAVALPYMTKQGSRLNLSQSQASFVASCVSLGTPLGGLIAGVTMEKIGRKSTLLLSCIPAAVGWFTIASFPSYQGVVLGRLITGFATGFCCHSATVFIAEGSTPSLRGVLVNGTNLGFSIGIVSVYILGLILKEDWRVTAGICGSISLLSIIILSVWMPESPVWLSLKGRPYHALKSLAKLRASHYQSPKIETELQEMTKNIRSDKRRHTTVEMIKEFLNPESYKPLIIMNIFFFFQQISGGFVVIFYGVNIVIEAGIKTDPFLITVLIGVTNTIFVIIGAWASKTFGRRPCAIFSGLGMTISLFSLTFYLYVLSSSDINKAAMDDQNFYSWIPALALIIFIMTSTVGFLSLPWAMLGEVFPTSVRGVACGLTTSLAYIQNFFIILLFPIMLSYFGRIGLFAFYATMSLLATLFVVLYLPETQNRSLAEIEAYFADSCSVKKRKLDSETFITNVT